MTDLLRTALFVPASRPDRIPKALASGADAVIVDLEDAVEPAAKDTARAALAAFCGEQPQARVLVRVNDAASAWFASDLDVCARLAGVAGIVLPKAESAEQVAAAAVAGKPVIPIIESARGVLELPRIAAVAGVQRLSFGALDLGLDLGMAPQADGARAMLDHVRCQLLLHGRVAGLAAPLDGVYPAIDDESGLAAAARHARELGFAGMLCIHPAQIPIVHRTYAPSEQEVDWARRVVQAHESTGAAAFRLDGKMVDAPVIAQARQVLARAASQPGQAPG